VYHHKKSGMWGYPSENEIWGGLCSSGLEQSPVNLPSFTDVDPVDSFYKYIDFRKVPIEGLKKPHTMEWQNAHVINHDAHNAESMGSLTLGGKSYDLVQFHIHTPSEHTVDGRQYPMEMQFVFISGDTDATSFAVVAVLFEDGYPDDPTFLSDLQISMEGFVDFNVQTLFDQLDMTKYMRYPGSFTTPPCTEGVEWTIIADFGKVPPYFLSWVTEFGGYAMVNNFREVQPLRGRSIVSVPPSNVEIVDQSWDYEARGKDWGGLCYTGEAQSPIDLPDVREVETQSELVDSMEYMALDTLGQDNGHTLLWTATQPNYGYIKLDGTKYRLIQFHMHSPSEHTFNGKRYDLEIQFEHQSHRGTFTVVSMLCEQAPYNHSTPAFNMLRASFTEEIRLNPEMMFDRIYTNKYFMYQGSFTSPPCTEGVSWIVLTDICQVDRDFLQFISQFDSMKNNYRDIQEIEDRGIEFVLEPESEDTQSEWFWVGITSVIFTCCLGIVAMIFFVFGKRISADKYQQLMEDEKRMEQEAKKRAAQAKRFPPTPEMPCFKEVRISVVE